MNDDQLQSVDSRALAICEEFCRYTILDPVNRSLLINVDIEYYHALVNRLKWLGYVELFKAAVRPRNTVTCTFLYTEIE